MRNYVTKKENIRLFKVSGQEQRSKGFVRGKSGQENNKTAEGRIRLLLEEFKGEIVSSLNVELFPVENLLR